MFEAQLSSESVTEKLYQNQQKVKGRIISVIDTPGLSTHEQIKELVKQFKEGYSVFNNTDEEKQSHVAKLIEKTDMVEENGGQHYMHKEAQRLRLEEEEKLGVEEPLSLAQNAAFLGAGVVGGLIGGTAAAAVVGCLAHGAIVLVAPIALIGAGVALMAEGGAVTISRSLKVWKEQRRNTENGA